jgi:hypothetical protein
MKSNPGLIKSFNRKKPVREIRDQQHDDGKYNLKCNTSVPDQESNEVGYGKLCQHILKAPHNSSGPNAIQCPSKEQQQQRAFYRVPQNLLIRIALSFSRRYRKWNRYAHDKHEERLDEIPEMHTMPRVMRKLRSQKLKDSTIFCFRKMLIQARAFADE